ncbi:MAG: hypothetical protein NT113_05375 [Hyphomicrobiales bacterium]|nr:hypothetical protein [Hyphomicrobiales bacterium]
MPRIGNARTIADIEYVIEPPGPGNDVTAWLSHGVQCEIERHRYAGQSYSFLVEILQLRYSEPAKPQWHIVILAETWRFGPVKIEARSSKSLKVIKGKQADILAWMRRSREQKLSAAMTRDERQ